MSTKEITRQTPLTYPGSKRLIRQDIVSILQHFQADTLGLCSPFVGGGSVELHAALQGIEVNASDGFSPLVEFWQVLKRRPSAVSTFVYKTLKEIGYSFNLSERPHDKHTKRRLSYIPQMVFKSASPVERAGYLYIRNKTCYSGMMFKDKVVVLRGTNSVQDDISYNSIERLRNFYSPNFHVKCMDYRVALMSHPYAVLYCDPPYVDVSENLYGIKGSMQNEFCHYTFHENIVSRDSDWVLSYDNHPLIHELYKDYYITTRNWTYGMGSNRVSDTPRELIICSRDPLSM